MPTQLQPTATITILPPSPNPPTLPDKTPKPKHKYVTPSSTLNKSMRLIK